jgi:hypothetical protein
MVMRVLATARLLWADGGAVPIAALPSVIPASAAALATAVEYLCGEAIAERCEDHAALRLTDHAAGELFAATGERASSPC